MHKYISHKYTLAPPFSLTYIPWPWIMPPLSCENLGRLPYLSEPHFFGKRGSHVFGSGVGLERCMNFPGSWLKTCQEVGVHWRLSDRGSGCSPVAHLALSVDLFFSGDLPNPGIEPRSPALQGEYLLQGKPKNTGVSSLSIPQ